MGLDWHTAVRYFGEEAREILDKEEDLEEEEKERIINSDEGVISKPCFKIRTPLAKERENFHDMITDSIDKEIKEAEERKGKIIEEMYGPVIGRGASSKNQDREKDMDSVNKELDYLESIISNREGKIEERKRIVGDKFDCERCRLLDELNKGLPYGKSVVGMLGAPCDFRGKVISNLDMLPQDEQEEAYNPKSPEEMLEYADRIEGYLERKKEEDEIKVERYEDYCEWYDGNMNKMKKEADISEENIEKVLGKKLDKEEFEQEYVPEEVFAIETAVHWLRTMANNEVSMDTSY